MKKIYITLSILFCCIGYQESKAQVPCSGSPQATSIIPTSFSTCAGSPLGFSLALTYTTTGITYQWGSSTISAVGPFSPIAGATLSTYNSGPINTNIWYNIIITCTNSSQSFNTSVPITVVNCPNPCSGVPGASTIVPMTPTVCNGGNINMSLSPGYTTTGITYQWGLAATPAGPYNAIPGATLSTYNTGALNANSVYNVTVTCTNSNQFFIDTNAVSVINCTGCAGTPGSNTVISSPTVCVGGTVTLNLANSYTAGGITYQWQTSTVSPVGPFTSIPGATLSSYVAGPLTATRFYNVVITCLNSSQSISAARTVSVVNCGPPCIVNANFTLVPSGTPQLWNAFPASTSSIAAVQWSWGDGSTSNTLFTSHQYSAAGMYSICLSVTLTCGSSTMACASYSIFRGESGFIQVNVLDPATVDLVENAQMINEFFAYPNPSDGKINLVLNGKTPLSKIEVKNVVGQLVFSQAEDKHATIRPLDLTTLKDGVYFITVYQNDIPVSTRITITH